jgi:hypothetical protein
VLGAWELCGVSEKAPAVSLLLPAPAPSGAGVFCGVFLDISPPKNPYVRGFLSFYSGSLRIDSYIQVYKTLYSFILVV